MDPITEAVLLANASFYRALSLAELRAMEAVWLTTGDSVCAHPGQPPLHGWEAIRESWRGIFLHQGPLRVWPTEAATRVFGQTAEVNCFENIDMGRVTDTGIVRARAVNVFRRVEQSWKLVEHHVFPLPYDAPQPVERFSHN